MSNSPHSHGRSRVLFVILAGYLLIFLVLPLGRMLLTGFYGESNAWFGRAVEIFFDNPHYRDSLLNSLAVALGAAVLAAFAALPVGLLLWRFRLQPPLLLELFGFLPLFVPPFMLSLSLQSLLGRGGGPGLLLQSWGDLDPALWGLPGVALIEAIHYFPLVLMTLVLYTATFSRQAHEAVRMGTGWARLAARVFLPLGLPGLAFGMAITFLKTLDDLATPLSLGITNLLAPQAYFRVATYGAQDPLSSLMAIALIGISALLWTVSAGFVQHGATRWNALPSRPDARLTCRQRTVAWLCLGSILAFYLAGYAGMILTSVAKIWSYTPLPESYVLSHYASALRSETGSFINTLLYCGFAAIIDVLVGLAVARAIEHAPQRWNRPLIWSVTALLSVPGVALAIAYLQFFQGMQLPLFGTPLDATWFLLPMAFSVRGLPFAIRACSFARQNLPVSCVEAARFSGATRLAITLRVVLPMMAFGLLVAFLICFGIAAVDLSLAMLLVPSETDAPVSYSIYLNMQTSTGRGTGSALAVLAIAFVAAAMTLFVFLRHRNRNAVASLRHTMFQENPTQ